MKTEAATWLQMKCYHLVVILNTCTLPRWGLGERACSHDPIMSAGVSLAQDRGRLEARVELLATELETQKKQNVQDIDALRIKTKIIDDQTETIRKLKEVSRGGATSCLKRFVLRLGRESIRLR